MEQKKQTVTLSTHIKLTLKNDLQIVFQSALDQWTEPIQKLFNISGEKEKSIKVVNCEMNMTNIDNEVINDHNYYKVKTMKERINVKTINVAGKKIKK